MLDLINFDTEGLKCHYYCSKLGMKFLHFGGGCHRQSLRRITDIQPNITRPVKNPVASLAKVFGLRLVRRKLKMQPGKKSQDDDNIYEDVSEGHKRARYKFTY